jgi:hypothetical protein
MRSRLLRYLSSKFEKLSLVDIKSIVGGWVEFYQNKKKEKKKKKKKRCLPLRHEAKLGEHPFQYRLSGPFQKETFN